MNVLMAWKNQELRKINALFNSSQQLVTLVDGVVIIVHAEDESWIGKPATDEEGTSLSPGQYHLASTPGSNVAAIIVGKDGLIEETLSTAKLEAIERLSKKVSAIKKKR